MLGMVRCFRLLIIATATATGIGSSHAQSILPRLPPPDTAPLETSPVPRVLPEEPPKIAPPMIRPSEPPSLAGQGEIVEISSVDVVGSTVYPAADIESRFASFLNQQTPIGTITEAVQKIETAYHDDGYFLTRVRGVIEPSAAGNVLTIHVTEGYISAVKIDGDIGPAAALIYGYLKHLEDARPLNSDTLERFVLLAKNVPGVNVQPLLVPSKDEPGAVQLVAQVDRKPFDATLTDDNRGPRTVGPNELLVEVAGNSFTSLGDRTSLILYNTPFDNEELFGQASEDFFVGTEGLKLSGYLGYGVLVPGDILRVAGYKSRLLLGDVAAEYPVIRTRGLSLYLTGNFDISNSIIDEQEFDPTASHRASKDDLRILRIGVKADFQDVILGPSFAGANSASLQIHRGLPEVFGGSDGGALYVARPKEIYDFTKITALLDRTQNLYSWAASSLAAELAATGQWTRDILPPSEKFFLGGAQFGRGFYNGEITGDRAVEGKIELQFNDGYDLPWDFLPHVPVQYYGFYDTGQAWNTRASGDPSRHIESVGVGIHADLTTHISVQVETVHRFTRRPTGDNTSPEAAQVAYFRIVGKY
jgi:hemolysin activation/secretion protein